jgi:hypothetical protein
MQFLTFVQLCLIGLVSARAFPRYASLAGMSNEEVEIVARQIGYSPPQPAPPPLQNDDAILVNNPQHPFIPAGPEDQRGPCPGLNTLASHGYLSHTGVDTPQNLINAVMNGLNMGNDLATFVGFAAFLTNGNPLTNLISIGGSTPLTGQNPPPPAIVGGLDTHNTFEGDISLTRLDEFLGNNHAFNQGLFDEVTQFADMYGGGKYYNFTVASEYRYHRVQQSIAQNPTLFLDFPRFETAYAEAAFPFKFMVDGRIQNEQLPLQNMFSFFSLMHLPDDFYRRNGSCGFSCIGPEIDALLAVHNVLPGSNAGKVNSYTPNPNAYVLPGNTNKVCATYYTFVKKIVQLYPKPQGLLLDSLKTNLRTFYSPTAAMNCTEQFPYGM